MTTTQTAHPKAEIGRRVLHTRYRDLPHGPAYPGVITSISDDQPASLRIRLDGTRCNLHVRPNYEGLTYLDEVTDVPALPMGRFIPVADDRHGFHAKAGVLVATVGEDGEDLVLITADLAKAREAAAAYAEEIGLDLDSVDYTDLRPEWVVFTWEPEDADSPWLMDQATEGDDHAIHIYYLPA